MSAAPTGYPVAILGDHMNAKYQCWQCRLLLKNPLQSYCGHRLCKDCMLYLVRTNTDEGGIVCRMCIEEDTVGEESYLKQDETFPDNAIRREMSILIVYCSFDGCSWTGQFKEFEAHYETCEFMTVTCEVCGQTVLKRELEEHRLTVHTTGPRPCPFGCGEQVESANLSSHVMERIDKHFDVICTKIAAVERSLHGSQTPRSRAVATSERCVAERLADVEANARRLEEALRSPAVGRANDAAVSASVAEAGAAGGGDVQSILASTSDKMTIYEGVITVLNREVEKLTTQMDVLERQRQSERDLLDAMDRKVRSQERLLAMKDATIAELELRLTSVEQTSYDGTLLWRITDFQRKRQDAISGRVTSIYSPPFFTSRTGYKMCVRLYLNGDGMGKGSHISLFFVVMRGAYDALLKWPFRQKVTLMFIDQNGREHVVDAFRPDPTSSSFKRPTTEMNIASGCPLLMPLTTLDAQNNSYVKDNTAFIKVIVNCDDLN